MQRNGGDYHRSSDCEEKSTKVHVSSSGGGSGKPPEDNEGRKYVFIGINPDELVDFDRLSRHPETIKPSTILYSVGRDKDGNPYVELPNNACIDISLSAKFKEMTSNATAKAKFEYTKAQQQGSGGLAITELEGSLNPNGTVQIVGVGVDKDHKQFIKVGPRTLTNKFETPEGSVEFGTNGIDVEKKLKHGASVKIGTNGVEASQELTDTTKGKFSTRAVSFVKRLILWDFSGKPPAKEDKDAIYLSDIIMNKDKSLGDDVIFPLPARAQQDLREEIERSPEYLEAKRIAALEEEVKQKAKL